MILLECSMRVEKWLCIASANRRLRLSSIRFELQLDMYSIVMCQTSTYGFKSPDSLIKETFSINWRPQYLLSDETVNSPAWTLCSRSQLQTMSELAPDVTPVVYCDPIGITLHAYEHQELLSLIEVNFALFSCLLHPVCSKLQRTMVGVATDSIHHRYSRHSHVSFCLNSGT